MIPFISLYNRYKYKIKPPTTGPLWEAFDLMPE